ncbi:MAG: hypothetical protein CMN74_01770 [Sphingorhabdus sp.]|nr:hypothetical protein [Sphingorhabdus sp.]|tara:strand:- start:133 stop:348 length:216 start_codon:yes stop_codon:yes gene_type:complete
MRSAAKILFVVAVVVSIATLSLTLFVGSRTGEPGVLVAGVVGAFNAAIPPFIGAAIIWRLDIWLFERGDRP